jgi:hypothetical protein
MTPELKAKLLNYLANKPWKEVHQLIIELSNVEIPKKEEVDN